MRYTDCGEDKPKDSPGDKNVGAHASAEEDYRRREAIERKRDITAFISVKPARHPPQRSTQPKAEENERKPRQETIRSGVNPGRRTAGIHHLHEGRKSAYRADCQNAFVKVWLPVPAGMSARPKAPAGKGRVGLMLIQRTGVGYVQALQKKD
jgi:hypothetical protein